MPNLLSLRFFITLLIMMSHFTVQAESVISEHIDIHQFSNLMSESSENTKIIDVRTSEEFHAGHLPDAMLIDFYAKNFVEKVRALDKDTTYLLYCRTGNRSGQTLKLMRNLGFKAAYNMKGGMNKWAPANYPVVKP
jgi:rhodanese-related sulfurtransferase|tara:strand:- start:1887 stop:2294 length:408 start_codon:yes stop_codon:yes gene_type:complete